MNDKNLPRTTCVEDLQDLIFNPTLDAGIELQKRITRLIEERDTAEAALASPATVDPTDPGHEVEVLREHVRHLERRVRQLASPAAQAQPVALTDEQIKAAVDPDYMGDAGDWSANAQVVTVAEMLRVVRAFANPAAPLATDAGVTLNREWSDADMTHVYATEFCPYKGSPAPWTVWQASWAACFKQAQSQIAAHPAAVEVQRHAAPAQPVASVARSNEIDGFGLVQWAGDRMPIGTLLYRRAAPEALAPDAEPAAQVDERATFEAWAESQGYATLKANGAYLDRGACHAWFGWRAARAALTPRPAAPINWTTATEATDAMRAADKEMRRFHEADDALVEDGWTWDGDQWQRPSEAREPLSDDTRRLKFMMERGYYIGWSKDGEVCSVMGIEDEEVGFQSISSPYYEPRDAIDAVMRTALTAPSAGHGEGMCLPSGPDTE